MPTLTRTSRISRIRHVNPLWQYKLHQYGKSHPARLSGEHCASLGRVLHVLTWLAFTWRGRRTQLRRIPPHVVPLALLPIYHSILPGILRANQAKLPVNLLHSLMSTTLVTFSSLPLKGIENNFAVDSSGFSTCRFVRWFNKKYGREIDNREWVTVHLMCGVDTKIVTSVDVSGWAANDTPFFVPLLERTAKYFQVQEVSADKAYISRKNLAATAKLGAMPYIPFKTNTALPIKNSVWAEMYHYFMYNREDFLAHYHKRSNVETAFSMIKGKFGDSVRSKHDIGQLNEVLCKVLCHNLCVLIQAIHELGIEPRFEKSLMKATQAIL